LQKLKNLTLSISPPGRAVVVAVLISLLLFGDGVDRVDDPREVAEEGEQEAEPELELQPAIGLINQSMASDRSGRCRVYYYSDR
jgi:hypothetical protein